MSSGRTVLKEKFFQKVSNLKNLHQNLKILAELEKNNHENTYMIYQFIKLSQKNRKKGELQMKRL